MERAEAQIQNCGEKPEEMKRDEFNGLMQAHLADVANRLRLPKYRKIQEEQQAQMQACTATQYWKTMVKTEEDAVEFYRLYFPQYPEALARALAKRMTKQLEEGNVPVPVQEEEAKEEVFDFKKELESAGIKARF